MTKIFDLTGDENDDWLKKAYPGGIAKYRKDLRNVEKLRFAEEYTELPISLVIQSLQGQAFTYFEELNMIVFDEPQGHIAAKLGSAKSGYYGHQGGRGGKGNPGGSKSRAAGIGVIAPSPILSEDDAFGTVLVDKSYGEKALPETVYRGALYKDPIRFVEGGQEFITGIEKRSGMFGSPNEDEAAFFAALSAIQQGAKPKDTWEEEGRWNMARQQPWVYRVSSDVKNWEKWEPKTPSFALPFSGKHSDIVIKQRDVQLERVRLVTKDELASTWRWLRDMGQV